MRPPAAVSAMEMVSERDFRRVVTSVRRSRRADGGKSAWTEKDILGEGFGADGDVESFFGCDTGFTTRAVLCGMSGREEVEWKRELRVVRLTRRMVDEVMYLYVL